MCLAIPGSIEAIDPSGRLATAEVMGVRREVSIDLIADENPQVGDWILIHVGFAMSLISADDARPQDAQAFPVHRHHGRVHLVRAAFAG